MHAFTIAFIMAAASGAIAAPAFTSISGIPGGCNPAHPGSCPSSYFETSGAPAATSISGIPGGCNPAHPGSCPSSYFETSVVPSATSIPGGCNPAHPGSCPSSYFQTSVVPAPTSIPGGCNPAHPGSCPSSTAAASAAASTATGNTWTVKNLSRYCSDDSKGCDYNFKLEADGAETNCTVIQLDVGPTGNWGGQKCTDGSNYSVYWGYSADASPPFAVMTINNDKSKTRAFFGVPDVNGQKGSTYGSGSWAELGPEPVLANN